MKGRVPPLSLTLAGLLLLFCLGCYSVGRDDSDAAFRDQPSIRLEQAKDILDGPVYLPVRLTPEVVPLPTILDHSDSLPLVGVYYFDRSGQPALRLWERPCHPGYACWEKQPPDTPDGVRWRFLTIGDSTEVKVRVCPVPDLGEEYLDLYPAIKEYVWYVALVVGTDEKGTRVELASTLSLSDTLDVVGSISPFP